MIYGITMDVWIWGSSMWITQNINLIQLLFIFLRASFKWANKYAFFFWVFSPLQCIYMYVIQDVAIYGKKIDPINIVFGLLEF